MKLAVRIPQGRSIGPLSKSIPLSASSRQTASTSSTVMVSTARDPASRSARGRRDQLGNGWLDEKIEKGVAKLENDGVLILKMHWKPKGRFVKCPRSIEILDEQGDGGDAWPISHLSILGIPIAEQSSATRRDVLPRIPSGQKDERFATYDRFCDYERLSERPAARRDHWELGRPSVRNCSPLASKR